MIRPLRERSSLRNQRIWKLMAVIVVATVGSGTTACTDMSAEGLPDPPTSQADRETAALQKSRDFSDVDSAIDEFVAVEGLNGAGLVVVDRDEGTVHEYYAGEFSSDRISLIASSSKMLTAGVLLRLADQGLLEMNRPVAQQVEWEGAEPEMTPAQLLSNSSGLVGLTTDPMFAPYICQYLHEGNLQDCGREILTTELDDADVVPPDTEFRYGGGQWQVAGAVAEAVSGKSWDELLDETYIRPCGVESLGYNNHFAQPQVLGGVIPFSYPAGFHGDTSVLAPTSNPNMEGGAYITAPDYARLLLMHLRSGRCGDVQVLSSESVDLMHTDRVVATYGGSTRSTETGGYGMGWWVDMEDPSHVEDGGAFGAVPWLDLDDGYGVYLVIEKTNDVGDDLADVIRPLINEQMTSN